MILIKIYGQNKQGYIKCIGLGSAEKLKEIPFNHKRIDQQKLIGETVVFLNTELNIYYYIKVIDVISLNKKSYFVVDYKNNIMNIRTDSFVKKCNIQNILKERVRNHPNEFYKKEDYWIMKVKITKNEYVKELGNEVEILFDGDESTINAIKNSTWFICKNGKSSDTYYVRTGNYFKDKKTISLHQAVYGRAKTGFVINHIYRNNGSWKDNRLSNLEEIQSKENSKNISKAGFPRKKGENFYYKFKYNNKTIEYNLGNAYMEADVKCLIIQQFLNLKHRFSDWYILESVEANFKKQVIESFKNSINCKKSIKRNIVNDFKQEQETIIILGRNRNCLISVTDKDLLAKAKIRETSNRYWRIIINGVEHRLHRYILGIHQNNQYDIEVDHINNNPNDNRRGNLIITSRLGNLVNKKCKGYRQIKSCFRVHRGCYYEYLKIHNQIHRVKEPTFKTEQEAKEEVFKRKWLANYIRPQFKNYTNYLNFKKEYELNNINNLSMDDYWIQTRFPNINAITIPKFSEENIDKL